MLQPTIPPPMITACASDFIPVPPEGVPRAAPCTAGEHRGYQGTGGPATDGEYAYAVREPSIPQADIIQEAERLPAAAGRLGLCARHSLQHAAGTAPPALLGRPAPP